MPTFVTAAIAQVVKRPLLVRDGCRMDSWPRHTKDVIKMVPVATLFGTQHYKASTGFSSLTNHA